MGPPRPLSPLQRWGPPLLGKMVEYITHSRDVVTEAIYPEAVTMVGAGEGEGRRGKGPGRAQTELSPGPSLPLSFQ